MSNKKDDYGWGLVVLMFFLFWPVGLFLLITKLSKSAQNSQQNGQVNQNGATGTNSAFPNSIPFFNKPVEEKKVTCQGCGAPALVRSNQRCVCEYCGNILK